MKIFILFVVLGLVVFALRAGELYTQLARYKNYWDYQNGLPIEKDDLVYVAFGDSAAQGVGATKPEKGYVGLIANEIEQKTGKNVKIINLSKSGAKVSDVLKNQLPKYEQLSIQRPALITIEAGANDILSFDAKKFELEMNELMDKLPKGTVISDIPSFNGSRLAKYEDRVIKANDIIYKLAEEKNIKLAFLYNKVKANSGIKCFAFDLFHPSNYGYRTNWLPAFMARIDIDKIK